MEKDFIYFPWRRKAQMAAVFKISIDALAEFENDLDPQDLAMPAIPETIMGPGEISTKPSTAVRSARSAT